MDSKPEFRRPIVPDTQLTTSRRAFVRGLGALGFGSLLTPSGLPLWARPDAGPGLVFPLVRGPFQNNGATPWYNTGAIGTPAQPLKIALDSGSNFIWITSTLCAPNDCQHYGGGQFDYAKSSTFKWIDQTPVDVSFGPWGTMTVETGQDLVAVPRGSPPRTNLLLAKSYSGSQFAQLDWDGGIGMPSGSDYVQPGISFFFADLMNSGAIDPAFPYLSFDTDTTTPNGVCQVGGYDPNRFDPSSAIFMPWSPYQAYPDVEYLWTTQLKGYAVGSYTFTPDPNAKFSLDSGSSQFKGDDGYMNTTLEIVTVKEPGAVVVLQVGQTTDGATGVIKVPPSMYDVKIEAGPDAGKVLPQFQPLGLDDLVLVGSVLMDSFYTIFEYQVSGAAPNYHLSPVGMWLFQKTSGPRLLPRGKTPAKLGARKIKPAREFRNAKARSRRI